MLRRSLALLAGVAVCLAVFAAQETITKEPSKAVPKGTGPGSGPKGRTAMEKLINALSGTWSVSEIWEKSETMPQGGTGYGRVVYRPGPGGQSLVEEYRSEGTAGEYSGLGVIWWDEKIQGFLVTWCDTSLVGCRQLTGPGKWEGDRLVLLDETETLGKKSMTREVYSDFTSTSFTQTLATDVSGGGFKPFITIKNTRMAKPAAAASDQARR